jgi:hypothetical protein
VGRKVELDLLVEGEAGFQRAAGRARVGDARESLDLVGGEPGRQVDAELHLSRADVGVVADVDANVA